MSYEKNIWKTGDIITSEKLNRMEDGIANAGGRLMIGGFTYDEKIFKLTGTADKTWQEIDNALVTGVRCIVVVDYMGGHIQLTVTRTQCDDKKYSVYIGYGESASLTTTSADGYPTSDSDQKV